MEDVNAVSSTLPARPRADVRTFAEIAEAHLDAVFRYLVFVTGDRGVAEDLTGETFEKAFRWWRRYDPRRASARTWLCKIARSTALDHFRAEERRRTREQTYARDAREIEDAAFGEGMAPELERALHALSPGEREVVALRVLLELDGPGAARVLHISETACSTRLSRALRKLEEAMTDE